MPENTYNDRELDQKFGSLEKTIKGEFSLIHQRMDSFESETSTDLMDIKAQTTKTNGRVTKLEESEVENRVFRARF